MYIENLILKKIDKASILKNPIDYCVIENFLPKDVATLLSQEFPAPKSDAWHVYINIAEDKKTCYKWNLFKAMTYKYFAAISSRKVTDAIGIKFNIELDPDCGLHGGGQHFHSKSGNLNPQLEYSIHPKHGVARRINIIY